MPLGATDESAHRGAGRRSIASKYRPLKMIGTQTQAPGKLNAASTMLRTVRWMPVLYRLP
jgi:hypothetical protein